MPIKIVRVRKKKKGPGWWSEGQKVNCVAQYLIYGNVAEVCRQTNIPQDTVRKWKGTDWWTETEAEIRKESNQEIQGKLGKILNKSLDVVEERLMNGDLFYDVKTGSIKRIGVKASVANQISKDSIDRKIILEKIANKGTSSEEAVSQRLLALKQEFLKFVNAKQINAKEVINAEFAELQEKLPAGEQVQIPAFPDKGTGRAQPSAV